MFSLAKPYARIYGNAGLGRVGPGSPDTRRRAALMSARAVGSSSCGSLRQQNDGVQKVLALSLG